MEMFETRVSIVTIPEVPRRSARVLVGWPVSSRQGDGGEATGGAGFGLSAFSLCLSPPPIQPKTGSAAVKRSVGGRSATTYFNRQFEFRWKRSERRVRDQLRDQLVPS